MHSIAIIGSGICGLTIASALRDTRAEITIYDKGRRPGGRAASRTIEGCVFDHGAPAIPNEVAKHFVADTKRTKEQWLLNKKTAHCPIGGISNFSRDLADDLRVLQSATVLNSERNEKGLALKLKSGASIENIDTLILTPPAIQSAELIQRIEPTLCEEILENSRMSPAWVVLFKAANNLDFEDYTANATGAIANIRCERTKPGREESSSSSWYTAECSLEWSKKNLEKSPDWVSSEVLNILRAELETTFSADHCMAHRWRYASTEVPIGSDYLVNDDRDVWIAGDWCRGNGIESAHTSGLSVAQKLKSKL